MKRFLLPACAAAFIFTACDKPDFLKTAAEKATPIPATPKPTPKKGDWMYNNKDGGRTLLDQKSKDGGRTLLDQKPKK
jgi:hypothetical protein